MICSQKNITVLLYYSYIPGCSGKFFDSKGVLASPNFPFHYNIDEMCDEEIVQPVGSTISYQFDVFDVEQEINCGYDKVEVSMKCCL